MISLSEYINEAVVDDPKLEEVKNFLKANYSGACRISSKPNSNGLYVVNCSYQVCVKNSHIDSLTNGLFEFGKVGDFNCSNCDNLKDLNGAPKDVHSNFRCNHCKSLTSLEGAPKEVGGLFICRSCGKQFTEKDIKKVSSVGGKIIYDEQSNRL